jgi:hypothetical protein
MTLKSVTPGDQITDMDGHKPTWKSFLDWEVYSPFEITAETFYVMLYELKTLRGELVMNKMAYAVSSTTDVDGEISSIFIIYRYDHTYHGAMLFSPKWKNLI